MPAFQTPGVYTQHADASRGGSAPLRTDIAGFAGIAQRGPVDIAVPVESLRQFQAWFGAEIESGFLAYCARAFFENGGRRLWAVRVASAAAASAYVVVTDSLGAPVWRIEAASPGVWGNDLKVRLVETRSSVMRAQVDSADPACLRVASTGALQRLALVQLIGSQPPSSAVAAAVDSLAGTVRLAAAPASLKPGSAVRLESVAYALEVYESGRLIAAFDQLSLVPEHPRYGPRLLAMPWQKLDANRLDDPQGRAPEADLAADYFRIAHGVAAVPPPVLLRELRPADRRAPPALLGDAPLQGLVALDHGADGLAALSNIDFIGASVYAGANSLALAAARRGIAALEGVEEVALLAVPDIHVRPVEVRRVVPPVCEPDACLPAPMRAPALAAGAIGDAPPRFGREDVYAVQAAMIAQCERQRDRIALLDAPFDSCNSLAFADAELRAWRSRFDSAFAMLLAPWLAMQDPLRASAVGAPGLTRALPPCGHVAGLFAAADLAHGVHSAPANIGLAAAQAVTLAIDDERHGLLNALGVGVIRAIPGRGLRLLGARSLSSDPDWRFITVRRLVSMVAKAINLSIQWAVFEPNDWRTRSGIALAISAFLRQLWSRGALAGATPAEAFYVRCDDANNPPDARAGGRLLAEVGIAPTVPLEFIELRVGRDAGGFAVVEANTLPLAA